MDIQELEQILGITFHHVLNPYTFLQENYPQSYRDVMSPEEEMVRTYHQQHVFVNEEEQIIGINLFDIEIDDSRLQEMLSSPIPHLQSLNLGKTGLSSFTFSDLNPKLVFVDLNANENLTQIKFETTPEYLILLEANQCKIKEVSFPAGMDHLKKIDLSRNTDLTSCTFQGPCPALEELDLSKNTLQKLHLPEGFKALKYVFLHDNQLNELTFEGAWPQIETLHLSNNQLRELPDNILDLEHLETLYLYNNPWESIKDNVLTGKRENSRESVFSYLTSIQDPEQIAFLNEAKMILVGNGMVGKSSIRRKLINPSTPLVERDPDDEEKGSTQGIEVDSYIVEAIPPEITQQKEHIDFVFNIWDFGGQGKYREIQQLFCSHRALYLFVTCWHDDPEKISTQNYVSFPYWLHMVSAYGYDDELKKHSPILLVINKIDEQQHTIHNRYTQQFDHIYKDEIHVSCKTGKNFQLLCEAIVEILPNISPDIFTNKLNKDWLKVKEQLEKMKPQNYIPFEEYKKLYTKHGLSDEDGRSLANKLNQIGTIIYFNQHPTLKEWIILEPEWVRKAMYQVIDHKAVQKSGRLDPDYADSIWVKDGKNDYSDEEREKFIEMMMAYKLCYPRKDAYGSIIYIVPACLPEKIPQNIPFNLEQPDYRLQMIYNPFVPAGTVNKLIVSLQQDSSHSHKELEHSTHQRMKGKIEGEYAVRVFEPYLWKDNVILQQGKDRYARVREDWRNHQICVDLFGKDVKDLFEFIENALEQLNTELKMTKNLRQMDIISKVWDDGEWREVAIVKRKEELFYKPKIQTVMGEERKKHLLNEKKLLNERLAKFALDRISSNDPGKQFELDKEIENMKEKIAEIDQQL